MVARVLMGSNGFLFGFRHTPFYNAHPKWVAGFSEMKKAYPNDLTEPKT